MKKRPLRVEAGAEGLTAAEQFYAQAPHALTAGGCSPHIGSTSAIATNPCLSLPVVVEHKQRPVVHAQDAV
jgi:hypothetical protein